MFAGIFQNTNFPSTASSTCLAITLLADAIAKQLENKLVLLALCVSNERFCQAWGNSAFMMINQASGLRLLSYRHMVDADACSLLNDVR
ncbi:hypothetical protein O9929_24270 [Vibrio lentus]|nr:hypothetical protein [Vibrio lentus]